MKNGFNQLKEINVYSNDDKGLKASPKVQSPFRNMSKYSF